VARLGARATLLVGMLIAAVASGARGMTDGLYALFFATIITGLGVAVMQPAVPRLVREWVPERIGLGTAVYSNGMLVGALTPIALTLTVVMPLVGDSWRLNLVAWAMPVLAIFALFVVVMPLLPRATRAPEALPDRWWPDWKSPLTWTLGLTFGCNNSIYYALSAVLPEYLSHTGRGDLVGTALLWLNLGQIAALILMLWLADRLLHRAWPYLFFGVLAIIGLLTIGYIDGLWVIVATAAIGLASAVTFGTTLALPPALSRPDDVHRTAAGMFTIAYASAVVVPIICGALWDHLGIPQVAFLPIAVCALGLTVLGASLSRYRPARAAPVAA
jgi:CP family cyanate transporter-like MFS transporter